MIPHMKSLVNGTALALAVATLTLSAQTKRAAAPAAAQTIYRRRSDDPRDAGGDGAGPRHVARARAAVPDPHRDLRGPAQRGDHRQPGRAEEADERDRERAQGKIRGPLHGIPIALKDNIHTTDMPTTGGALAFEGWCRRTRRR